MKTGRLLLLILPCILLLSCNEKPLSTLIETDAGTIEGTIENGIKVFRGIPFAAPPVGDLRWKEPQPVKPWEGVLKTVEFGPACPQPQNLPQSEDCLYLNVWTPAKYPSDKLPVMVWIHGGGFSMGAPLESTYFGEKLTQEGVIYVSVAYRLGVLGFLAHPELSAESPHKVSGNYGLLDQIAALQWVRRN
ncbi:MAG TPA: carboxylesterase family protein, partial [Methanospirillum sp.]|uniref:carboxylesterase family protein n=1 Tax=Methanospirillum sp. TaxID=45200 RepID=UPI002BBF31F9